MKRILCIWLPTWPIQRLVVDRPELKGAVVILHASHPRRGRCVIACSRAAYQCGVRPGMPLSEAVALQKRVAGQASRTGDSRLSEEASRQSDQVWRSQWRGQRRGEHPGTQGLSHPIQTRAQAARRVVPCNAERSHSHIGRYQPETDIEVLRQLTLACERFSPIVGLESSKRASDALERCEYPSCLYLDVTHVGPHFGGEHSLARQVAQFLDQRGYHARIGLAETMGAAWAAAHFGSRHATQLPPAAAQVTTSPTTSPTSARPSFWVIAPGDTLSTLQSLPIQALRLPAPTVCALQQLGISQISQFARLPRSGLASRFGAELLKRWDQVLGIQEELLTPYRPAPTFQADWSLEHPSRHRQTIRSILERLVQRVSEALVLRGEGAIELFCRLDCSQASPDQSNDSCPAPARTLQLRVSLFQPTVATGHLLELLDMQLEQRTLPGPVQYVAVRAETTAPLERRQQVLFSDPSHPAPRQLAQLVDRLSSRLGRDQVVRPQLRPDAQPERAYAYQAPAKRSGSSRQAAGHPRTTAPPRPLLLCSPPLPLEVVAIVPDGPPVRLHFQRRPYRITRYWGPERIETGWWRGRSVRRDYYRVETESGCRFWLFRQLDNGQWFLHGMFH